MNKQESRARFQALGARKESIDSRTSIVLHPKRKNVQLMALMLSCIMVMLSGELMGQCTTTISDFTTPHRENFENENSLWGPYDPLVNPPSNTGSCPDWVRNDGGTITGATGPSNADQGLK